MNIKMIEMCKMIVDTLGEEIAIVDNNVYWGIQYKDKYTIHIKLSEIDNDVVLFFDIKFDKDDYVTNGINSYNGVYKILGYACLNGISVKQ